MQVRLLTSADAAEYQAVRLRSLCEHPEAFGTSAEEEQDTPLEKVGEQLVHHPTFGAFVDETLIGIVSLFRYPRLKTRHRAILGGMYVAPEARGQGAGKALLQAVIEHGRGMDGLEDIVLAVTVGNHTARSLYRKMGFIPYSIDPRFIRVGERYHDIEWMFLSLEGQW